MFIFMCPSYHHIAIPTGIVVFILYTIKDEVVDVTNLHFRFKIV